jgi:hypothetical protein
MTNDEGRPNDQMDYLALKAMIGLTRVARRAGIQAARKATAETSRKMALMVLKTGNNHTAATRRG